MRESTTNEIMDRVLPPTPQITAKVEWIDPPKAEQLLDTMVANRKVSHVIVGKYIDDMQTNNWFVTNQGIGIDSQGRLIDGQHRLWAIIESGRAVKMLVVRGINPQAFRALDSARNRTFSDDLHIQGYSSYTAKGSLVRLVAKADVAGPRGMTLSNMGKLKFTRIELEDFMLEMLDKVDLDNSVNAGARLNFATKCNITAGASFYYMVALRYGPETAQGFLDAVIERSGLFKGDPKFALRDRLERLAGLKPRPPAELYLGLLIKAFNADLRGERVYRLEFREQASGRLKQDKFPEILEGLSQ